MGGSRFVRPDLRALPSAFAFPLFLSLLLAFLAVVTLAYFPVLIFIPRRLGVSVLGTISRHTIAYYESRSTTIMTPIITGLAATMSNLKHIIEGKHKYAAIPCIFVFRDHAPFSPLLWIAEQDRRCIVSMNRLSPNAEAVENSTWASSSPVVTLSWNTCIETTALLWYPRAIIRQRYNQDRCLLRFDSVYLRMAGCVRFVSM